MNNSLSISDLTKTINESNLPTSKAEALESAFMPFFEQAAKHCETAFQIKVTNLAHTAEMGRAKTERIALKDLRIAKEKVRKDVKEDALREGKAIDKIANFLDSVIEPMEKYLLDQEKYGERLREQMQVETRDARELEAGKYLQYFPESIDLGKIADEEFANLLHYAKATHESRVAAEEHIEKERIEREQREAAEKEALRAENERLRAEAAKHEAEVRQAYEAAEKERIEAAKAISAERAEVERLRREAEAKEQQERERLRKEQEGKEVAEKAALSASDRVKIESIISEIKKISIPDFAVKGSKQRVSSLIFDLEIELTKIAE
jgi:hypothetical protein